MQQQFQVNAVKAIVECFAGQPKETARFTLERSAELIRKAKLAATSEGKLLDVEEEIAESIGYRNRPIHIAPAQILQNIKSVQNANEIIESEKIERPAKDKNGYAKEKVRQLCKRKRRLFKSNF